MDPAGKLIAPSAHRNRPEKRANGVQETELSEIQAAQSHGEGYDAPQPIQEPEREQ